MARSPACSIATAACAATSRSTDAGASGSDSTGACQITISTPATSPSRSTGSKTAERALVASTSGGASAGWLRASATKYASLALNARPPPVPSPRGWIVTGCTEMPAIAVDAKSRPDGSKRNAIGASMTSHAASQMA